MLSFFVSVTPPGVQMMTEMSSYLDFVMVLLLCFGLAFEIPIATVLLVWTGFVKIKTLKKLLGPKYIFESSYGHVRDLPEKEN